MSTKQEKIEQYLKEPLKVGEHILVKGHGSQNKQSWGINFYCGDEKPKRIHRKII
jgi:hypothetical protein